MNQQLALAIADIAADRTAGSSEILERALAVLQDPLAQDPEVRRVAAVALCRAQPSMAPMWNAAAAALAGDEALAQFAATSRRSVTAVANQFADFLPPGHQADIVTFSWSSTVRDSIIALAQSRAVAVTCGEGRPLFEGRMLATALARAGLAVTLVTDAAVATGLSAGSIAVFGADAVGSTFVVNKVGTRAIAAAAFAAGVPIYVLAGRDKLVAPEMQPLLTMRSGSIEEVWASPADGVAVRNPYYEETSLDLITAVVTDIGILEPGSIAGACASVPWRAGIGPLKAALDRSLRSQD